MDENEQDEIKFLPETSEPEPAPAVSVPAPAEPAPAPAEPIVDTAW